MAQVSGVVPVTRATFAEVALIAMPPVASGVGSAEPLPAPAPSWTR
ncbi:hypothetical protein [Streptomyces sp. HUCO-GS316]